MVLSISNLRWNSSTICRALVWAASIVFLFSLYVIGIGSNPPGFYVDESGLAYNAYLVSQTGAGEFGPSFPLYFQLYTGGFTQYSNPTQIYLLAAVFWLFGPSVLLARLVAAASVFAACLLLGALAARVSGRRAIGAFVALSALLTPWLFEVGRLVLETFFYPMAVVLFLWAVYRAQRKDAWDWSGIAAVALTLTLLTYSYTIGRLLAPLLALGLIFFATSKPRFVAILKTWVIYGLTLVPMVVFLQRKPDLTTRFYLLSYIKPDSSLSEIVIRFVVRFFEDINPIRLLSIGDVNPRHHIPDAFGSFFAATFVLAVIGIAVVLVRHRNDPWWRFVVFGLAASVVPGALTVDPLHTLRMIAYPIFLLMLMVPALEWLLEKREPQDEGDEAERDKPPEPKESTFATALSPQSRRAFLALLLAVFVFEASYFHWKYQQEGAKRGYIFDAAYKQLYDEAVVRPNRPIYLVDAYWGPAYMNAFWYATLEGRSTGEFIHQPYGKRPPAGAMVLSTEQGCTDCVMISHNGDYILYLTTK